MEVDKNTWHTIQQALKEWENTGLLTKDQAECLRKDIVFKRSERQQVARYFFLIALFCTLLAFGAIFINEKFLEKIKAYFSWSDMVISLLTALLSAFWFWYTGRKRKMLNPAAYEAYMVVGGLAALTSLIYACKELRATATYLPFLTPAIIILTTMSILLWSQALWIGALLALISWFGIFSTVYGSNNLFAGMNYPVRFMALGGLILIIAFAQKRVSRLAYSYTITYFTGLLLFFTGLWAVSVFGNYSSLVGWHQVRQIHVLAYAICFGIGAAASFYLGIRYKDDLAKDFGLLFLLINLYTRYFEYFWNAMNKGIFFLVLAITFGFLGWWLDRSRGVRKIKHAAR